MLNILISSLFVGIGSYFLREGNLSGLILFFFKRAPLRLDIHFFYTLVGIILNLFGIYFWQSSAKSNLSYAVALSLYLSITLIVGIIVSFIVEKTQIGLNFFLGTFLVTVGIFILAAKN